MDVRDYIVRPWDTLWDLAEEFETTVKTILDLNPQIKNPNLIYVGQKIRIPDNRDYN